MKILILSDDFPPISFGGAGIAAYRLAKILQNIGHEVFIFSTTQDKKYSGKTDYDNLPLLFIENNYNLKWHGWVGLYNKNVLVELEKVLVDFKPDVVQANNIHGYISYAALKLSKQYCKKVFLTAHDTDLFYRDKFYEYIDKNNLAVYSDFNYRLSINVKLRQFKKTLNPFRRLIINYYLGYVNKVFAVSNALKKALNDNGVGNVEVIYNGLICDNLGNGQEFRNQFNITKDTKIILLAGRFNTLKGGRLIACYIKEISQQLSNFIFVFAGQQNNLTKEIQQKLKNDNLEKYILFTCWLNSKQMKDVYQASNVVVTPSIYLDVFNLTNIEAMCAKKPVVGTCFGGTPEIVVDGVTGYIVNPYDIKKTAEYIIELLKNKEKSDAFGLAGYKRVLSYFSLIRQVDELLKYYNQP